MERVLVNLKCGCQLGTKVNTTFCIWLKERDMEKEQVRLP